MCAVCDLDEAGNVLAFSQFYPVPGSQNKFFILKDPASRLFWMVANLPADSRGAIFDWDAIRDGGRFLNGPGNDRRFLMLFYGARATDPHHSFMYPSADIDGDDMVLISRTSLNAVNQHDADVVTFHRIRNFRSLAMNLFPA